jgi:hypothetical protein
MWPRDRPVTIKPFRPGRAVRLAPITVSVLDTAEFAAFVERVRDFVDEYATHHRNCAAVDADGDWCTGNLPCDCGYDESLSGLADPNWCKR